MTKIFEVQIIFPEKIVKYLDEVINNGIKRPLLRQWQSPVLRWSNVTEHWLHYKLLRDPGVTKLLLQLPEGG